MKEITLERLVKEVEQCVYMNTWEDCVSWIRGYRGGEVYFSDLEILKEMYDMGIITC